MRWRLYLLVSWVLIVLTSTVASGAITVNITTNPDWTVANGHDYSIIMVNVSDSGIPLQGANVAFSVNDTTLGFVYPESNLTLPNGITSTTFSTKTKSGTANISVSVNGSIKGYGIVNIDHDTPYSIRFLSYPPTATVGSINWTNISMQDRWGNLVDNRNETEQVKFSIITLNDASRFWNSTLSNFSNFNTTVAVDNDGMVRTNITLGTVPGDTLIRIQPPLGISELTLTIKREANGEPYSMYLRRDPSVPYIPADNKSYFVFSIVLYDKYGNGLNNKEVVLNSSRGDWGPLLLTTYEGKAAVAYGPYSDQFTANVLVYAKENISVNQTLSVEFYDPSPRLPFITISPNTMQSLDSNNLSHAIITAALVDMHGKPVPNQTIPISITNTTNIVNTNTTPYLESRYNQTYSAYTGSDGYARITFYPGSFKPGLNNQRSECNLEAAWGGNTSVVKAKWMNFNYLSATTTVEPLNVVPGQNITVCLNVDADGPGLSSRPIDLILCTNRGTSMLKDMFWLENSSAQQDKMVYLYDAGQYLLKYLNTDPSTEDWAGIVSYGSRLTTEFPEKDPGDDNKADSKTDPEDTNYINAHYTPGHSEYPDFGFTDLPLTSNMELANASLKNVTPYGPKMAKSSIPMRYGIYKSIQELNGHGDSPYRDGSIKAIILLADQDWDDFGDPTAGANNKSSAIDTQHGYYLSEKSPYDGDNFPRGGLSAWTAYEAFDDDNTSISKSDQRQNLAYYAAENGIYIFTVAYFKKGTIIPPSLEDRLTYMAYTTGGDYYVADTGEGLGEIFNKIGERLRKEASVNTTATLNFTKVKVGTSEILPGSEFFDYLPIDNVSTYIRRWNQSVDLNETRNDSLNWTDAHKLEFDIGTMYIGDHWSACFTLHTKENTTGLVQLIDEGSEIVFNGGQNITIPGAFPYVQPIRYGDQPTENLTITNFHVVNDTLNAIFDIDYTGDKTVHVKLYYQKLGDISSGWNQYATLNYQCNNHICQSIHGENSLNKFTLGTGLFMFKIDAWASDTPMDTAQDGPKEIKRKFFIWLQ
jgi:hypothetical protein